MVEPQPILKGSFGEGKLALLANTWSGGVAPIAVAARIAGQRPRLPDDRALIMRPELRAVRRCG
jgi:hypothetical protein